MKVKFKKTNPNAKMPVKAHFSDFCYDVFAASREEIAPNVYKYGLGIALQVVREDDSVLINKINNAKHYVFEKTLNFTNFSGNISIDLRPRSSVWKTGLVLSNCTGTIDEGYTGEISAVFYKVAEGKIYEVGDRIGQIKLGFTLPMDFIEVDEIDDTERGAGAYGSSGLR